MVHLIIYQFFFQTDPQKASFHLPLHRYFSVFLRQAVKYQGFTLKELLPESFMLSLLIMHPLRVQVGTEDNNSNLFKTVNSVFNCDVHLCKHKKNKGPTFMV